MANFLRLMAFVLRITSSGKGALLAGVRDTGADRLITDWSAESEEDPGGEAIVNNTEQLF